MWLELKYINLLSNRLRNFKRVSQYVFNFSCPLCGDSLKDTRKARGYVYEKDNKLLYHCHNCGAPDVNTVSKLIHEVDPGLYKEYQNEKILEKYNNKPVTVYKKDEFDTERARLAKVSLSKLKRISELQDDHPVVEYLVKRKIPKERLSELYLAPRFMAWVNTFWPNKFSDNSLANIDGPRIVIPGIDENGNLVNVSGRALDKNAEVRYLSIVLGDNRIYGLDRVNFKKPVVIVEGAFDSMMVDNCIAVSGGDLYAAAMYLKDKFRDGFIIIYDNEPRNKQIVKKLNKSVNAGHSVVIWPHYFAWKDINEAVMAGLTLGVIEQTIYNNTVSGLQAELKFQAWRK